jgi:hypothetical protein
MENSYEFTIQFYKSYFERNDCIDVKGSEKNKKISLKEASLK